MRKESIRGWKDVFTFTLLQTMKSKTYLISLFIMVFLAIVSMPVFNMIMSKTGTDGAERSALEKVYLYNMTMYRNLDMAAELEEAYQHIVFEETSESLEAIEKRIQEEEPMSVALVLVEDEQYCYLQFLRSPDSEVSSYELQMVGQFVQNAYTKAKVKMLGLSEEQMKFFEISVVASANIVDTERAIILEDTSISETEYWFLYGAMFVVLMVCVISSSQVASSIVQEKSSKIVEYLLTSVRPLAIILGKICAMLVCVLVQMSVVLLAGVVSMKVGGMLTGDGSNAITQFLSPQLLHNLNFFHIILGIIMAGAGMVLYATLAGLCGATASRMEDVSESLTLFTITALIGFYIGFGAASIMMVSGDSPFVTFALIFPLSSAFLLPGALCIGKAGLWTAVIAMAVLLLSVWLMFEFVAKVYEGLILHNGNRVKIKEVIAMAKGAKQPNEKKGENAK